MKSFAERANVPRSATATIAIRVKELKRKGVDVISLGAGEPGFVTPPHIIEFAKKALDEGNTFYSESPGLLELREAIGEKFARENGIEADPASEIVVTVGGKEAVFDTILALVNPGDEVIITDPCWVTYEPCVLLAGGKPVHVSLREDRGFSIDLEALERSVTPRTKLLVINSPNNPTGGVLGKEELRTISELAVDGDLFVLSDELYEYLTFDGLKHYSIASFPGMRERTITVNGFSKAYAMTGWRLGYMVSSKEVIRKVMSIHEHSVTSASTFSQKAAAMALRDGRSREFILMMAREYEKRRNILAEGLRKLEGVVCPTSRGAFYAFPNMYSPSMTSVQLADFFLEKARVATVPGEAFGKNGQGHLRLTFTNPEEELREATRRMAEAHEELVRKPVA